MLRTVHAKRALIFAGRFSIEKACLVHAVSLGVELNGYQGTTNPRALADLR